MRISRSEPGYALSAAVHFGLLAAMLVAFSHQQKFEDAQEAVPVETISENQLHEIMKGVKSEKKVADKPKVDKVADKTEQKPTPPTPEAKRDVPTPPSPMKKLPDPSEAEDKPTPPTPTPPPRPVPTPPVKPPPQEAKEEPEDKDAEPIKPPTKPKPPEKKVEKPEPPRPPEKPAPKAPKLDEVAKLLSQSKDTPASKPKSGQESHERPTPNLAEISKLLSHEAPKATVSTGRQLSRVASLGAPTATGAHMSPSLSNALNGILQEQYKACWSYLGLSNGPKYVPRIRVFYRPDGSLDGQPTLTNPTSDPTSRSLADSALRAVRRCNPLKIPAQFQPYYEQWKDWLVNFDPEDMN